MMVEYTCERCGYRTNLIGNYKKHLHRQKVCQPNLSSIDINILRNSLNTSPKGFNCEKCSKSFACRQSKWFHKKTCNGPPTNIELLEKIKLLEKRIKNQEVIQSEKNRNDTKSIISNEQQNTENHIDIKKTKSKQKIPQALRIACWNKYIGEEIGKALCICCKTQFVTQHNFQCGHVEAESKGGKLSIENLRPICFSCNNSMGTTNMIHFAKIYFNNCISMNDYDN